MLYKLLSYILPVKIFQAKSKLSKTIEITWVNGELVMDSENTNYSYGSLQRILRKGLNHLGFEKISKMNNALILGVAGGSVIKTLVDEINFKGQITGVDIDPNIIKIANDYFKLDEIKNLNIVIDDAFEFVLKTKERYDLIVIDIFQDTTMPNFLFEKFFINRICFLLQSKGVVLFNTMCLSSKDNLRNQNLIEEINDDSYKIQSIPRVEVHNELIIIEKLD
ncbi:spermidine synthase [Flavobacterium gilvum]|uniref:Spermidine synthase n=1 Tax=Flavobacterium gilvum TaxID=1492737 RepID=A0AAC9I8N8_9FLAO|nr:fused MFS/spermidine synthase [Flavobacterium gilvum]AOW10217.1 spermidine synthase [Flavobacterium gilvum]KFC58645.1 spermidine synthase-like protein [Flavobacterium gilvum]